MKRGRIFLAIGLGIVAMVLFYCPNNYAQTEELKIGFIAPLSGGGMSWGYASLGGLELRMDKINAEGGLKVGGKTYKLKAVPYDSKYLADPAITATKRLIYEDKVKIIFGTISSAAGMAMQGVTEPQKIILFCDTYTSQLLSPEKPYTFRFIATPIEFDPAQLDYYRERWPNTKKIAYIYPNDETGQDMLKWEKKYGAERGFEVIGLQWERGTPDLTPVVTKAVTGGYDIVDCDGLPPGQAGQAINTLREMGWKKPIARTGGAVVYDLLRICGKNANGVIYHEDADFSDPKVAEIVKQFEAKKYPATVNTMLIPSYDGASILFEALKKAGTVEDTDAIKAAMESITSFSGVQGPVSWVGKQTYGINHQMRYPVLIGEVKDEKPTIIKKVVF
jgi:branched-chain amino acid transport system substrate-binding protein